MPNERHPPDVAPQLIGELAVYQNRLSTMAAYATLTDEEIALSDTPRNDRVMRARAQAWIAKGTEERVKADLGWPREHALGNPECTCWFCEVPFHLRGWDNRVWNEAVKRRRDP